ncbi:hypothetical protein BRD17_07570 [Halobacteriales archaeon SW_7_68_16]|nr:MAG: hypothetical protein BRD17_07570 [Halobacteriales archaeon SW_7_68_16]
MDDPETDDRDGSRPGAGPGDAGRADRVERNWERRSGHDVERPADLSIDERLRAVERAVSDEGVPTAAADVVDPETVTELRDRLDRVEDRTAALDADVDALRAAVGEGKDERVDRALAAAEAAAERATTAMDRVESIARDDHDPPDGATAAASADAGRSRRREDPSCGASPRRGGREAGRESQSGREVTADSVASSADDRRRSGRAGTGKAGADGRHTGVDATDGRRRASGCGDGSGAGGGGTRWTPPREAVDRAPETLAGDDDGLLDRLRTWL